MVAGDYGLVVVVPLLVGVVRLLVESFAYFSMFVRWLDFFI